MDECYNIENIQYDRQILTVRGWIFSSREEAQNGIQRPGLLIVSHHKRAVSCRMELHSRPDVAQVYGLSYDRVGFFFQEQLKVRGRISIYLLFYRNWQRKQILMLETDGGEPGDSDTMIQVTDQELDGYYSMRNFQLLRKRYSCSYEEYDRGVDVIIPVYNGYPYLARLFQTISQTRLDMRIIVVNDCSTDRRIRDFFHGLCREYSHVIYLENTQNQGFVRSVNRGLKMAVQDVALVNTDIEVPPYWLERLMRPVFLDRSVASATPYTNCGTLCSFPDMGRDNPVFDGWTVNCLDAVFRGLVPSYTQMPTGVGFCMGMSKDAIDRIGLFDEENFGKGYGEENDWCQRAVQAGFRNVQVENLFVYHKHGGSFMSEEKAALLAEHTGKLKQMYPRFMEDTAKYFEQDINRVYRRYALFLCLMQTEVHTIVYFNHALGGGAQDYFVRQKQLLTQTADVKIIEFRYNAWQDLYQLEIQYKSYQAKFYAEHFDEAFRGLKLTCIQEICINELAVYPGLYRVLEQILMLKRKSGARLTMLLHDYFCICPTINLLTRDGRYCGMECSRGRCLEDNPFLCDAQYSDIQAWRQHWKSFLEQCDSILAFSEDTADRVRQIYGDLPAMRVAGHETDRMLKVRRKYKYTDTVNVAVIGVLSRHKGLHIVKEMLAMIEKKGLPVRIFAVGPCEETIKSPNFTVTGRYTREQLPALMYLYDIDLVFLPSVWPETFSYTAEEAMKMDMPTAVFDIGAAPERVKKYAKGMVIPRIRADLALGQLLEWAKNAQISGDIRKVPVKKRVLFLLEYESFSSRYRVDHFREHLAVRGIGSEKVMLQKLDLAEIADYDAVFIYRCSDVEKMTQAAGQARKHGLSLIYDIDDLIFDYQRIQDQEFLKGEEYRGYESYCENIRACMELCDMFTASTDHLAAAMRESFPGKRAIVCRNAASLEMQLLSEIAEEKAAERNGRKEQMENGKVVLGYFSGSKTHDRDWKAAEDGIREIMKQDQRVELLLAGTIHVSDQMAIFQNRIKKEPFMRWQELPRLIRTVDINLMPLEDSFFQWCKSENKWMEAGLVGVPTIASCNPELAGVLRDGYDVVFCRTRAEWQEKLRELVESRQLREEIGRHAKEEVYRTHLTTCHANFDQAVDAVSSSSGRSAQGLPCGIVRRK